MSARWGYLGPDGAWIVPPEWDGAGGFSEARAWVVRNGKVGFIDELGQVVVDPIYANAWPFSGGLAKVARSEHDTIVIDRAGVPRYSDRQDTWEGLTPVGLIRDRRMSWGVVDVEGRSVIELAYGKVKQNAYAIWAEEHDERVWHIFSRSGAPLHVYRAEAPLTFLLMVARLGSKWVLTIGSEGPTELLVFDERFELQHRLFGNTIRRVEGTDLYRVQEYRDFSQVEPLSRNHDAYYDASFRRTDPPSSAPTPPTDEPRLVRKGGKWEVWFGDQRFADGPFQEAFVVPPLVWVKISGKGGGWGAAGLRGWVVPAHHPIALRREDDWIVGDIGKLGLADVEGRWLFPPTHTSLKRLSHDRVAIYEGGKAFKSGKLQGGAWRLYSRDGRRITEEAFAGIGEAFSEGRLPAASSR